ncbi:hypothetical protein D1816_17000 [Aquimarina sp. AD10]|uniref:Lipocalin-like domain-containing protein n=1 Tax=Aquimarina aggregata TaxID=1642818 RepID=A0A162ZA09_9FLAO|nr:MULTISPECIES: hypothetical protein [Aquimarina]AXT61982.1 hypothetical protein D1816_17000 [Aquimarina sp. AD10]KZS39657.1 hypothetical protein AWE51_08375 [Aquimarina aggregata]RKN02441.1 hypothetical protein D7033_01115 [Aquimarina sp. AD10]
MIKQLYLLFLVTVASTLLISCSNDDDSSPDLSDTLALDGIWKLTSLKTENGKISPEDISLIADFEMIGEYYGLLIDFIEPNILTQTGFYDLRLRAAGNEEFVEDIEVVIPPGRWSKEGNELTISFNNNTLTFVINKISKDKISLVADLNSYLSIMNVFEDEDEPKLTFKGEIVLELTKQN